jgi:uncharacterized cupredoxin-like copper-binding protein
MIEGVTAIETTHLRRPRLSRLSPQRVALALLLAVVAWWAIAQAAHPHATVPETDLSAVAIDRQIVVDASTAVLDLSAVEVLPGEVVEFVLAGSANSEHAFVLTGLQPAEMDRSLAANGDAVIRLRIPESGELSFFCAIPGHDGLHGSLVVDVNGA